MPNNNTGPLSVTFMPYIGGTPVVANYSNIYSNIGTVPGPIIVLAQVDSATRRYVDRLESDARNKVVKNRRPPRSVKVLAKLVPEVDDFLNNLRGIAHIHAVMTDELLYTTMTVQFVKEEE